MSDAMQREEIYDIYSVWYQPLWKTWQFKFAVIVLLLVVIFLVGYYIWSLVRRSRRDFPWVYTFKELDKIEKRLCSNVYLGENNKRFYFDLISSVKRYFVVRYSIKEKGSTDSEMVELLGKLNIPSTVYEDVQMIFEGAVTIKFANQKAAHKQMESDLTRAISIVKSSIPKGNSS